ncbi:MAG: DUF2760 domain-containing protein [Deltaproteobacteria bacterium]|nr:MAG: DUF2760 domain-containing protein [Deltaproteobacteria bacterium]
MSDQRPGFISRIFLSWVAYFRCLFDADFAAGVVRLRAGTALPADAETKENKEDAPAPKPVVLREATPDAALQLLSLLQREGRFIDFLEEDVASFSDADIGAAARVVHEGCKKALDEHLTIEPVRSEEEGAKVTLEAGFDAGAVRLTGNVVGEAPFTGTLSHRGWRVTKIELPKLAEDHDAKVLMAAEVEL